jgi:hypothetical protein
MLKQVVLIENTLEPETWERLEVEDVRELLSKRFDVWPNTGRIYHGNISETNDVTPYDESGVEKLGELEGPFYCVIYPGELITILIVAVIAAVAVTLLLRPKIPSVAERNVQNASPNNELSSRSNSARPNGRIPDIFGTVRSTPDLIASPYTTFIGNQEVENALMCIGVGQYEILDAYDGETAMNQIAGTSVQIYKPNSAVNSATPYYQIGSSIATPFYNVSRSNSVNGQVLRAPNANNFIGANDVYFNAPDTIQLPSGSDRDFTTVFAAGDSLVVTNAIRYTGVYSYTKSAQIAAANQFIFIHDSSTPPAGIVAGAQIVLNNANFTVLNTDGSIAYTYYCNGSYSISSVASAIGSEFWYIEVTLDNPGAVNSNWNQFSVYGISEYTGINMDVTTGSVLFNLNGTYTVLAVSNTVITLSSPASVNPAWSSLPSGTSGPLSPTLQTVGVKWVGPFILESLDRNRLFNNFIAVNGLYKDNGQTQYSVSTYIEIEVTPVNISNVPIGGPQYFSILMTGSSVSRGTVAVTMDSASYFTGRCSIRARRVNESDLAFNGNVVDEIKWRDLYAVSPLTNDNFGNVTLVRSQAYATSGALSLKERKANFLVTRQLPQWLGGTSFSTELYSTNLASAILCFITLNKFIGNRNVSELDINNIYGTIDQIFTYFGTAEACIFNYTFDKDNLSFEETFQIIANSVFCTGYRIGNVLRIAFEKETEDSVILFNHRNKLPGSENRTIIFGNINDNDGIEFEYVSPSDDAVVTLYLPTDRTAVNPKKIESVGIRNSRQAHFHAWREYNKVRYQNINVEFDATQEADLLVEKDRILVADNTRPDTQDGEITAQDGLIIYTSQDTEFVDGVTYNLFIQLSDKTVESIPVSAGPTTKTVLLSRAPRLPLSLDGGNFAQSTYILVGSNETRQTAFLMSEKTPQDNMTSKIRAGNYDARFYEHDTDFINGLI